MKEKLKQVIWSAEPVNFSEDADNDLQFGSTPNDEPAIKLGDKIVTPETIGGNKAFDSIKYINDYLYEITYDNLDYSYATKRFKEGTIPWSEGLCSSVRNGNFFGRNYDLTYDTQVNFVIRTNRTYDHWASIGVTSLASITTDTMEAGFCNRDFRLLPFHIQDGINEHGVFASIHLVPADKGITKETQTQTPPAAHSVCFFELVRFVLDNFISASTAVDFLAENASVYSIPQYWEAGYEMHFLIGDSTNTYVLEFVNNTVKVLDTTEGSNSPLAGKSYITNFHLYDVILNNDGTVYTPETQDATHKPSLTNNIEPRGAGLERYNLIVENYSSASTKEGMRTLMNKLLYTNSYKDVTSPRWNTEFVDIMGTTVDSSPADFLPIYRKVQELYEHRDRKHPQTWQTVHSSVYDISKKKLYLISQEDTSKEYEFNLKEYYTSAEVEQLIAEAMHSNANK